MGCIKGLGFLDDVWVGSVRIVGNNSVSEEGRGRIYRYPFVWQTSRTLVGVTLYVYLPLVKIYPTYTQSKNPPDSGILRTIIIVNSYA